MQQLVATCTHRIRGKCDWENNAAEQVARDAGVLPFSGLSSIVPSLETLLSVYIVAFPIATLLLIPGVVITSDIT